MPMINNLNEVLKNDGQYLENINDAAPFVELIPFITKNFTDESFYELFLLNFNASVYYISTGLLIQAFDASENCEKICNDIGDKGNLAISYEKLGGIYEKMGNTDEALKFYQLRNKLSEELHKTFPQDVSFKNDLAISYIKLAGVLLESNKSEAITLYEKAKKIWMELADKYPGYREFQNNLKWIEGVLSGLADE